jgi:hypothetical protein
VPEVPDEPEVPDVPLEPEVPEVPLEPEVPEVPDVPLEPEVPLEPKGPAVPLVPEVPDPPPEILIITKSFWDDIDSIPDPVNNIPVAPEVYFRPVGPNMPKELTEGVNVSPVPPGFTLTKYPEAPEYVDGVSRRSVNNVAPEPEGPVAP